MSGRHTRMDLLKRVADEVRRVRTEVASMAEIEIGQVMVITEHNCPKCEEMISILQNDVDSGGILVVHNDTPLGKEIEAQIQVTGYPDCIVKLEDGSLIRCEDVIDEAQE